MSETKPETKRPQTFQKGNPGGPGRGKKKAVTLGEFMYADLHAAYTQPNSDKDSLAVKAARKLFHDDYKTFMSLYIEGDKIMRQAASDARAKEVEAGPSEEKLDELLEQLLSGFERSVK